MSEGVKIIAQNRRAFHEYFIEEKFEAGISLVGTEVKSLRGGNVNMKDSYCRVENGEMFLLNMHISPYEQGNVFNRDPLRDRKLLLHKREILKIFQAVGREGYSIIPLSLYLKRGRIKVEIALARGKKLYDKRESIAKKDRERENMRFVKEQNRR
ncbi:MAG: SsrA-binding protein SmpB [Clostridia bacterium]|nr:SsrA-binding protein SmpB [Clostridia bacterium]